MYKDPDKQREAIKAATQRYRAKKGDSGLSGSKTVSQNERGLPVVDEVSDTLPVIPKTEQRTGINSMIKPKPELTAQGNIRVSKPGDADYVPQCETTMAFIKGKPKTADILKYIGIESDKRGKDIKTFADLSPDVQQTIDTLSDDKAEHKRRTAVAINYQHLFPGRFHSVGVI